VNAVDGSLTNVAPLTAFAARRDRVRIVVWVASIVLVVVATVGSIKGLYPTQADLDTAARASEDNAAAIVFNGPAQGLDTVGGQVAFQTGTFGLILMGLMSIFMLGRMTRGEEEAGRAELVRSLAVGAHALPASGLLIVGAMNLLTGMLITLALVAFGLPVAGSVVFGLSFTLFGLLLGACTLVAAQVTENTRVVYGIGGLVVGAAFLLRAIGDVGDGTISWLSPIGWAQKTRPYAGDEWWPFLVVIATTALLAWIAAALARHRDLGAALVAPRSGPVNASRSLGTAQGLATRLQRGSVIGWSAGMAALAISYGSITDSINDFVKDNKSLTDIVAAQGNGTIVDQYLAMSFRILALVAAGFAIQSALRIRSEEIAGRGESVLATPVSRVRWAASHLAIAFGGTVFILVCVGVAFGGTAAAVTGDAANLREALVGTLTFVPAVWVLVGITVALIGLVPRATVAVWGALGLCFVIGMFGQLLDLPTSVHDLSPFQHVPHYPGGDLEVLPLLVLLTVAVVLTALALVGLRSRDLG
jgi:ABC-2 type transport system permease protein